MVHSAIRLLCFYPGILFIRDRRPHEWKLRCHNIQKSKEVCRACPFWNGCSTGKRNWNNVSFSQSLFNVILINLACFMNPFSPCLQNYQSGRKSHFKAGSKNIWLPVGNCTSVRQNTNWQEWNLWRMLDERKTTMVSLPAFFDIPC